MTTVGEIIQSYGAAYQARYGERLLPSHQRALRDLAPYIFRVAISNHRIVKVAEGQVTFRYTPSGQKKSKLCILPAEEFIRRFLQHVLPRGFVKVRYYGLFAPGQRARLKQARILLVVTSPDKEDTDEVETETEDRSETRCPECGQPMKGQRLRPKRDQPP